VTNMGPSTPSLQLNAAERQRDRVCEKKKDERMM
jgi:hypothetical protein